MSNNCAHADMLHQQCNVSTKINFESPSVLSMLHHFFPAGLEMELRAHVERIEQSRRICLMSELSNLPLFSSVLKLPCSCNINLEKL